MKHKAKEPEKRCDVTGCNGESKKALPRKKAESAGLAVPGDVKSVHLCKDHYKAYKKATKEEREIERLAWG